MRKSEIERIKNMLTNRKLMITEVPSEIANHKEIVKVERELDLRKIGNRGFDVIQNHFFVEEEFLGYDYSKQCRNTTKIEIFATFEEYYEFLDGEIYDHACYKFFDFSECEQFVKQKGIDIGRLLEKKTFLSKTIDDFIPEITDEETEEYDKAENNKLLINYWQSRFDDCRFGHELEIVADEYEESELSEFLNIQYFLFNYISKDATNNQRFIAVMDYVNSMRVPSYWLYSLGLIYNPSDVIEAYNGRASTYSFVNKQKKKLKVYKKMLSEKKVNIEEKWYFDKVSHRFCEEKIVSSDEHRWLHGKWCRYFETLDEFVKYKGDLKGVDLSSAIKINKEVLYYKMDESTILPFLGEEIANCEISKTYDGEEFVVRKTWRYKNGSKTKTLEFRTRYFFDFLHFLKGDLSNAQLLFCEGLENLNEYENINFRGATLRSGLCEKFGVEYKKYDYDSDSVHSFSETISNEQATLMKNTGIECERQVDDENSQCIHYITDLHLMHRLENASCKSLNDMTCILLGVAELIASQAGNILLIGGDTASDIFVFERFLDLLEKCLKILHKKTEVIFVLGNHEMYGFADKNFAEITEIYAEKIAKRGMHLIQNEMLFIDSNGDFCKITSDELDFLSVKDLRGKLQCARLVILGGIGFAGCNSEFNAESNIYFGAIDRTEEIEGSERFETLYDKVLPAVYDKNTVVLTHFPYKDWLSKAVPQGNIVYVSGHTHQNSFYDDGTYRFYCDNQVGYKNENPHLKSFLLDNTYECFSDYKDGIYEITQSQYINFYRGKNLSITFTREINVLYMLKKKGYYCFIHKSKLGVLSILNGGAQKNLEKPDIAYYYDKMDDIIKGIKNPLNKYTAIQQQIANKIKQIGGKGTIHGCIVDIDWFNHIYVNPIDLKITGYSATNIIDKTVYPDVPTLLRLECPALYKNYCEKIEGKKSNPFVLESHAVSAAVLPTRYLYTDIYIASREISKLQKLKSNVLCSWNESALQVPLVSKQKRKELL